MCVRAPPPHTHTQPVDLPGADFLEMHTAHSDPHTGLLGQSPLKRSRQREPPQKAGRLALGGAAGRLCHHPPLGRTLAPL